MQISTQDVRAARLVCWFLAAFAISVTFGARAAQSLPLPLPAGVVILNIEGQVGKRNSDTGARLDYAMFESIGLVTRTIATDWTPSAVFEGVTGRDLVKHLGIEGDYLLGIAHDDYEVSIPVSDLIEYDTLFAVSMNGERLTMKNKGPVWLLYANENRPSISPELLNARMIWQLHTLVTQ